jgi:serine/threonine-protein kinase RsbW
MALRTGPLASFPHFCFGYQKAHVSPTYRAAFTGDRRNVPLARNAIASFARICGFSTEEVGDIRLAAGEALSNAVEHGRTMRSNGFSVHCIFVDDELTIEIRDNGGGFSLEGKRDETPIEQRSRGFGIFLMRRLMDGVHFDKNGTRVRLTRRHVS